MGVDTVNVVVTVMSLPTPLDSGFISLPPEANMEVANLSVKASGANDRVRYS
jgi:hypothetical protein